MKFYQEVLEMAETAFIQVGWKKKRKGFYFYQFAEDEAVLGWLASGYGVYDRGRLVSFSPNIGVCHPTVEGLVSELKGGKPAGFHPTVFEPLEFLAQQRYGVQDWVLEEGDSHGNSVIISNITLALETCGMEYVKKLTNLEGLLESIQDGQAADNIELSFSEVITLSLLGRFDQAHEAARKIRHEYEGLDFEYAIASRQFVDNFLKWSSEVEPSS